jgi:carbonic anhydrase
VFEEELAAADAYAAAFDLGALGALPSRRLAVLTCMDTRIDPLRIFGLQPGEAAVLRNAGARVDDAVRAALDVARDRLAVNRLLVLGHTDCRGTDDAAATVAEDVARFDVKGVVAGGFVYDVATGRVTPAAGRFIPAAG